MPTIKKTHNPSALVPSHQPSDKVVPISNLPQLELPAYDPQNFQIQWLQRQVSHRRGDLEFLSDATTYKDNKIRAQVELWQLGLDYGEWPTLGYALSNLQKLKGALECMG